MLAFAKAETIRVFPKRLDSILLLLPLALLILCLGEVFFWGPPSRKEQEVAFLLAYGLFLNYLHAFFTIPLILFIPELAKWRKKQGQLIWGKALAVSLVVLAALAYLVFSLHAPQPLVVFFTYAIYFLSLQHVVSQTYGISACYEYGSAKDNTAYRWLTLEKKLALAMCFMLPAQTVASLFFPLLWIHTLCKVLVLLLSLGWFCSSFLRQDLKSTSKPLFLCRVLLFGVCPFSHFAPLAVGAVHGTEYLGITSRIIDSSSLENKRRFWGHILLWTLGGTYFLTWRFAPGISLFHAQEGVSLVQRWMLIVAFAGPFAHYFLDGQIFKMRDPLIRDSIGKLISAQSR